MDPALPAPTPPSAEPPLPPPTAPSQPPPSPQPPPPAPPSTSEIPPPPTTSSAAAPASSSAATSTSGASPPIPTQNPSTPPPSQPQLPPPQQRPPLPRNPRPQSPYSHFMQPPSMSSSPHHSPLPPSSSSMPRGGLAIGVPAHQHPRPPPVGLSSYGQSTAFSQGYSPLPRNPGGPEQSTTSNSQVTTPITGIRNIGMFGSLSSGSQMRPGGVPGQNQHGPGQSSLRTASPSVNQSSQPKFNGHGLSRTPSIASPSSLSPVPQGTQSQQLTSAQGKQIHAASLPSSYRPQMKSQSLPQRPHQLQLHNHPLMASSHQQQPPSSQQQQHQQPQKLQPQQLQQQLQQQQLFQQKQAPMPHQSQDHHSQQYVPLRNQQSASQQQQAARAHGSTAQRSNASASVQSGIAQSAPGIIADAAESGNQILSKRSIQELVTQIDPSEKLDPEVENVLVEIADDFIGSITTFACSLAKHRNSKLLEAKDVLLHVERNWNITLPGYGGDEIKCYKKQATNDIHKERISAIKKSMVGTSDAGSAKNPPTAQAAGNPKAHSTKAPATTGLADRGS